MSTFEQDLAAVLAKALPPGSVVNDVTREAFNTAILDLFESYRSGRPLGTDFFLDRLPVHGDLPGLQQVHARGLALGQGPHERQGRAQTRAGDGDELLRGRWLQPRPDRLVAIGPSGVCGTTETTRGRDRAAHLAPYFRATRAA